MSQLLTHQELFDLIGERFKDDQVAWLVERKEIPFELDRQGWPKVHRCHTDRIKELADKTPPFLNIKKQGPRVTEHEVIESRTVAPNMAGIYFLLKGREIIYIGQSTNILYRIGTHSRDIEFDSYSYIPCQKEHLLDLERSMIRKFNPPLNKHLKSA